MGSPTSDNAPRDNSPRDNSPGDASPNPWSAPEERYTASAAVPASPPLPGPAPGVPSGLVPGRTAGPPPAPTLAPGTVYGSPMPLQQVPPPPGYTAGHAHTPGSPPLPEVPRGAVVQDPDPVPVLHEFLACLAVAVVLAALGFLLGALWHVVAPGVPAVMTSDGAVLAQPEQEQMIADEGWYLIITVLAGIVVSIAAWVVLRRYRGWAMIVAITVGSVAAGILAWWTGHHIGLAHARDLIAHAPVNTNFAVPPNLRVQHIGLWHGWLPYADGDLLTMAIAAALTYLVLAGFSSYPALRPPKVTADPLAEPLSFGAVPLGATGLAGPVEPTDSGGPGVPGGPVSSGW